MSAAASLAELLGAGAPERGAALAERARTLLAALGAAPGGLDGSALTDALDRALVNAEPHESWLALAVMTGQLPSPAAVRRTARSMRLDGPLPALIQALTECGQLDVDRWPAVEVVSGRVVVDVHHTAGTSFATGIQRVARETVRRWRRDHDPILLGWTDGYTALRRLTDHEIETALDEPHAPAQDMPRADPGVVVPWRCTHVLPELLAESDRALRYEAFAAFSRSATGLIGFDCVPLLAAETSAEGMAGGFAGYLAAAAHLDRIATISEAAAVEYRGWRTMLAGAGQTGPDIAPITLAIESRTPTEAALREARESMVIGGLPIILAVGSHEPRKNHLAVLHAAEVLWREGLRFSLIFVGGNSWNSGRFIARVASLREAGRPVETFVGLPDDQLWAAYRLAYCTVFPSLHEGFGLPVAESLASGTPVITSDFGSMRQIAEHGGALLVDPRSDKALTDALRRLLRDPSLRRRLAVQAARLPLRSWDEYAAETWAYLVDGTPVASRPDPRPRRG